MKGIICGLYKHNTGMSIQAEEVDRANLQKIDVTKANENRWVAVRATQEDWSKRRTALNRNCFVDD